MDDLAKKIEEIKARFNGVVINDELLNQLVLQSSNMTLIVLDSDLAACITGRSEWGSSGGIGYYSQVRVYYKDQEQLQEWQWRDRYSSRNDRPDLEVEALGKAVVLRENGEVKVVMELINKHYGNWQANFTFKADKAVESSRPKLSSEQQVEFLAKFESEKDRIMLELNKRWEMKPLVTCEGYLHQINYRTPLIVQEKVVPEIGIAAFVAFEQIDQCGTDPQYRHNLYALVAKDNEAVFKAEDHGYVRMDGGSFLTIVGLCPNGLEISTKAGKTIIPL